MRVLSFALVALLLLASHRSSSPGVLAVRIPAVLVNHTSDDRVVLPVEQAERPVRKKLAEEGNAAAGLDASHKPATAPGPSSPSTVFDPDRMSKRRVRRGSDPIHNKC
ncbi:hypothetical protein PR202_gb15404 [Eleusine coracana subsp. coracana]|uniref:Uncharacterized protein n=1 Tax=Eleusine coracana subsp. coracana TaxID=191504 RepID=A0AAV5EVI1_ELECO|nr:hypothetical protein PR202_gb15404 [Eleusine coracana subsp. coracana]